MAVSPAYSSNGLPPETVTVEPGAAGAILGGSQDPIPEMAATPRRQQRMPQARRLKRRIRFSGSPQSAKRGLTLPELVPMAERPRPIFDKAWAVKDPEDENDAGVSFHDGSQRTKTKEGANLLDDWDALLRASSLSRNTNSGDLMDFVKAFFLTSGFPTPRAIVNFDRELIQMLMRSAASQDSNNPTIFSPHTIREEVAISEAALIARQLHEAERQVDAAFATTANRGGDNGLGVLDTGTLIALSKLGVGANSTKVIQTSNAERVKPQEIGPIHKKAKIGDLSTLPYNLILSPDVYTLLLMDTKLT